MKAHIMSSLMVLLAVMVNADQKLIDSTCKRTPNYQFCLSVFRGHSAAASVVEMGLVVTDLAGQKSNEALSIISKIIKGQPKLQKALQQCTEMHKNVIKYDLPLIKDAIQGNPKFAETAMVDVGAEASNCDAALAGNKVPDLNNVNKYMVTLAEVGRAIIRNLL